MTLSPHWPRRRHPVDRQRVADLPAFDGLAIGICGLKIGDRLNVRGVRLGDRLVAVSAEWVAMSVLEAG